MVNMKLSKIVELIKGPENTLVRLEVRSIKDKTITKKVRIIRQKIKNSQQTLLQQAFIRLKQMEQK